MAGVNFFGQGMYPGMQMDPGSEYVRSIGLPVGTFTDEKTVQPEEVIAPAETTDTAVEATPQQRAMLEAQQRAMNSMFSRPQMPMMPMYGGIGSYAPMMGYGFGGYGSPFGGFGTPYGMPYGGSPYGNYYQQMPQQPSPFRRDSRSMNQLMGLGSIRATHFG